MKEQPITKIQIGLCDGCLAVSKRQKEIEKLTTDLVAKDKIIDQLNQRLSDIGGHC